MHSVASFFRSLLLGRSFIWALLLVMLIGCQGDDCETAPCDCENKAKSDCNASACCEWGYIYLHKPGPIPGGGWSNYTVYTEGCRCKEREGNFETLTEKKITLSSDTTSTLAFSGILDGGTELSLYARRKSGSGSQLSPYLLSSDFRHLKGMPDVGETGIFFSPVRNLNIADKTSKAIHYLTVDPHPVTAIIMLEKDETYLFMTTTGLKGFFRVDEITETDNGANLVVALTAKYYNTGKTIAAETKGFYLRRDVQIEFTQPTSNTGIHSEQPGAFYNPITNSNNPIGAPIAFVMDRGPQQNEPYNDSFINLASPNTRSNYSIFYQNGNLETFYGYLDSSRSFEETYYEFGAGSTSFNSLRASELSDGYVFKASDGMQGIILIKKLERLNWGLKTRVLFDIKYTKAP